MRFDSFQNIITLPPDTDVSMSPLYLYNQWIYINLTELWINIGKSDSTTAVPLRELADI